MVFKNIDQEEKTELMGDEQEEASSINPELKEIEPINETINNPKEVTFIQQNSKTRPLEITLDTKEEKKKLKSLFNHPLAVGIISGLVSGILIFTIGFYVSSINEKKKEMESIKVSLKVAKDHIYNKRYNEALVIFSELSSKVIKNENPDIYADIKNYEGECYQHLASIDNREAFIKAINSYKEALGFYTVANYPDEFSKVNYKLGNIYSSLAMISNSERNLNWAIWTYKEALKPSSLDKNAWGYINYSLGSAYLSLSYLKEPEINAKKAIEAYEHALKVWKIKDAPYWYARTMVVKGMCFWSLGVYTNAKSNASAIKCMEEALKVFTPEEYPYDYAVAQSCIAGITIDLLPFDKSKIKDSIRQLDDTIKIIKSSNYSTTHYPSTYYDSLRCLATGYRRLSQYEDPIKNGQMAVSILKTIKEQYSISDYPIQYANTCYNLAVAYVNLAYHKEKKENLSRAVNEYSESLKIFTKEKYPVIHQRIKRNIQKAKYQLSI